MMNFKTFIAVFYLAILIQDIKSHLIPFQTTTSSDRRRRSMFDDDQQQQTSSAHPPQDSTIPSTQAPVRYEGEGTFLVPRYLFNCPPQTNCHRPGLTQEIQWKFSFNKV